MNWNLLSCPCVWFASRAVVREFAMRLVFSADAPLLVHVSFSSQCPSRPFCDRHCKKQGIYPELSSRYWTPRARVLAHSSDLFLLDCFLGSDVHTQKDKLDCFSNAVFGQIDLVYQKEALLLGLNLFQVRLVVQQDVLCSIA